MCIFITLLLLNCKTFYAGLRQRRWHSWQDRNEVIAYKSAVQGLIKIGWTGIMNSSIVAQSSIEWFWFSMTVRLSLILHTLIWGRLPLQARVMPQVLLTVNKSMKMHRLGWIIGFESKVDLSCNSRFVMSDEWALHPFRLLILSILIVCIMIDSYITFCVMKYHTNDYMVVVSLYVLQSVALCKIGLTCADTDAFGQQLKAVASQV